MELLANGERVPAPPEVIAGLALKLRRRRIRGLRIERGVTAPEILALVELLGAGFRDLLKEGGAASVLDRVPHPHLDVDFFPTGEAPKEPESAARTMLPANVVAALEEILNSPATLDRLERIRRRFAERSADGPPGATSPSHREVFDQLVWDFFSRPEWEKLESREARRAVDHFLEIVEHAVEEVNAEAGPMYARIESIKSFFRSLSPADLLSKHDPEEARAEQVAYDTQALDELVRELGDAPSATEAVRTHLRRHDFHENSLLILCDLLVSAGTKETYAERRAMFLAAVTDNRYSSASIARILGYISSELPPLPFEDRDSLVQGVFDNTADVEAITLFLVGMTDKPDVFRPILTRLAKQSDPFPLLVGLLCAPHLEPFRHILRDKLLDAARANQGALRLWARLNRKAFFRKEIFDALMSQGTDLIGPICKEVIAEGPAQDRNHLIERLRQEGTETALRLLVLGMTQGDECDPELVHALSGFRHPLAVAALREIVHRCNTKAIPASAAEAALQSLHRLGTEESWRFLWEVVQSRCLFLPVYRRDLRVLAARTLEGKDSR
jgi:hypothetical protein